jgi:hypothetical protein
MKKITLYFKIVFILFVVIFFTACAKKMESMAPRTETDASEQKADGGMAQEAKDIAENDEQLAPQQSPQKTLDVEKPKNATTKTNDKNSQTDSLSDLTLPKKQFIRTAQVRGKVKNNINTTEQIEFIIKSYGGYTTNSELNNQIYYNQQVEMSKDSTLEVFYEQGETLITAAVPQQYLDSALQKIIRLYSTIEHRKITSEDVSISILENRLTSLSNYQSQKRLQEAEKEKDKLQDVIAAEDAIVSRQASMISQQISNLRLNDRIVYAALDIRLLQEQQLKKVMRVNLGKPMTTPFGYRFGQAFGQGADIFKEIVLFIVEFWSVWLFTALFIFLYIKFIRPIFKKKE